MDTGPSYLPAETHPQVAFEGQQRLAVELLGIGENWSSASVRVEDPAGPLEIVEQRCRGERCGVVLRIRDDRPNMGIPIPSTIDTLRYGLIISGGSADYRAMMTVFPLDTIDNRGTMPLNVSGVVLAASAEAIAGSSFRAAAMGAPIRFVVFGDATFNGEIDVSAEGAEGRSGGGSGGAPGANGEGVGAGAPGVGGAGGGGGGGAAGDGVPGDGADGTPMTGGAGGVGDAPASMRCAETFEEESCGGGGGGGAAGAGGAGGGTLLVAALGTLDITAGMFTADGGAGADGSGGGGGGNIIIGAPTISGPAVLSAAGGAGGPAGAAQMGGRGAEGAVRFDGLASDPGGIVVGPAVDVSGVVSISDEAVVTIAGTAAVGAELIVREIEGGAMATTTADDGTFSVDVTLAPGINRLAVEATLDGVTMRSWVGTNIELETIPALRQALPRGATVDIVHLP